MNETERRVLIKELASAVSTQAQVANRAWLGLMTVDFFAVVPRVPAKGGNVSLPLGLGEVDPIWFHAVIFAILVILVIAFAAAHTQQVRAQKLAQSVVDKLVVEAGSNDHVHPRELFDMLRTPSLHRVAPLAQALRGKYQFFAESAGCPVWLRIASILYFVVLKLASFTVYFGLPGWALWQAYEGLSVAGVWSAVAVAGLVISGFCFLQVVRSDLAYAATVLRKLWSQFR